MCLGTFSRRARSFTTLFLFARVRLLPESFYVIGNFLLHKKSASNPSLDSTPILRLSCLSFTQKRCRRSEDLPQPVLRTEPPHAVSCISILSVFSTFFRHPISSNDCYNQHNEHTNRIKIHQRNGSRRNCKVFPKLR